MNSNQTRSLTSWSKGVPILPPELIDNIIDELSGDSRSLKACSLVTKSWTYSSQCHLFRCLKVGLTGIQDTDRDGRLDEFRRFLLSSPYPRSSIRELRIFCPPNVKAFVLTSEIALLLHYTPSLRRLHLQGINLRTTSEGDFNEAPTLNHRTLRVLEISGFQGSFWSFGSRCLFDLLRWLPQLEDLRIRMGALLNAPNCSQTQSLDVVGMDQHVQYIRVPSSVRSLHLKTFHFDSPLSRPFLTDALRKTGCAGSLTSITVGLSSIDEIVTSGRLIRDVGPRLLHLRLNLIDSGISRNNINGSAYNNPYIYIHTFSLLIPLFRPLRNSTRSSRLSSASQMHVSEVH